MANLVSSAARRGMIWKTSSRRLKARSSSCTRRVAGSASLPSNQRAGRSKVASERPSSSMSGKATAYWSSRGSNASKRSVVPTGKVELLTSTSGSSRVATSCSTRLSALSRWSGETAIQWISMRRSDSRFSMRVRSPRSRWRSRRSRRPGSLFSQSTRSRAAQSMSSCGHHQTR